MEIKSEWKRVAADAWYGAAELGFGVSDAVTIALTAVAPLIAEECARVANGQCPEAAAAIRQRFAS